MSERGCEKCGYILTGLPAAGTIVTCPECGRANDLEAPRPRPMSLFAPVLWGAIPATLGLVCFPLSATVDRGLVIVGVLFLTAGLIMSALVAGLRQYAMFEHEPAMGRAPRPLWVRIVLTGLAGGATAVVYVVIVLALLHMGGVISLS